MAEGRVLRKKISVDERVAQLTTESALLFSWAIAHADVAGRIEGSAVALKATIVPLREWTIHQVDLLADEWTRTTGADGKERPLVLRYIVKGKIVIQFSGWQNNYGRMDREAPSSLPPPPKTPAKYQTPGVLRENSRRTPGRREGNGREGSRETLHQEGSLSTTRSEETGGGSAAMPNGAAPAYRDDPDWQAALAWVEREGFLVSPLDITAYARDVYGIEDDQALAAIIARAVEIHQEATAA